MDVEVTLHSSLNICKGTIYDRNLISTSEKEILEYLKDQGVTEIYKYSKEEGGKKYSLVKYFYHLTYTRFHLKLPLHGIRSMSENIFQTL